MAGNATQSVADYHHTGQTSPQKYAANLDVETKDLVTITELRATLQIPILQSENGMIHLLISGAFPLSKALKTATPAFDTTGRDFGFDSTFTKDPAVAYHFSGPHAPAQGPLPSLQVGITYQFDILH
jgi:hypothetical protein